MKSESRALQRRIHHEGGNEGVVACEYCGHGAGRRTAKWLRNSTASNSSVNEIELIRERGKKRTVLWQYWRVMFLPEGYPDSVSPDYFNFQVWDSIQALTSYIRGVLTTRGLMMGLGVGEGAATPLGAAFSWVMKDLVGMIGSMTFSYLQGSHLDSSAKQWRLFADCMNNVGLAFELAASHFPSYFLVLMCAGSVSKSLCGVAAGATRAAMTQHFARAGNAADIAAKEGSQETCTTLIGMLLGLALANLTDRLPIVVWPMFLALTILHVYSNYKAVRCLRLNSLNRERTRLLLHSFNQVGRAPSPAELSPSETLLPGQQEVFSRLRWILQWARLGGGRGRWRAKDVANIHITLGARLSTLLGSGEGGRVSRWCAAAPSEAYLLVPTSTTPPSSSSSSTTSLSVVLHRRVTSLDMLKALVHAMVYTDLVLEGKLEAAARGEALIWMRECYPTFMAALVASGWDINRVVFSPKEWRAEWEGDKDSPMVPLVGISVDARLGSVGK